MGFIQGPSQFGAPKAGTGQNLMQPKQAVAVAIAMKKKAQMLTGGFQAPNLMSALKKKQKGGQ
jgi:hypothetical protein